jgi:CRP-like cAMP-binding protein
LFGALSYKDRQSVAIRMRRTDFQPDQTIFVRGEPGRDAYLVTEGRIRLSVLSNDGRELSLALIGPGSLFGEIAALDGGERTATATAISQVQAMVIPQHVLVDAIWSNPNVAKAAIRFLCTRLRDTDQKLEAIAIRRQDLPDRLS